MSKKEFKKIMKKENKSFKKYYVYEMILILLLVIMVVPNIILILQNKIPFPIMIINVILIIIMGIPFIIMDIKNDLEIKKMYQYYLENQKLPEYKDKTNLLKIVLIISVIILIVNIGITIPSITKTEDLTEIENTLIITSNKGNKIKTEYEKFDGFKIKIPSEFKMMSDEVIQIKYPNGNPPSLVYTNEKTTINIALVMNDVSIKNTEIEEYVKKMESVYELYSNDVKVNFWERNNHKIGEIEFSIEAIDTEIYNHIIAFSVNGKLRLVNFNCTKELENEWKEISNFIINSIIFE